MTERMDYAVIDGVRYEVLWTDESRDPEAPDNLIAELAPTTPPPEHAITGD